MSNSEDCTVAKIYFSKPGKKLVEADDTEKEKIPTIPFFMVGSGMKVKDIESVNLFEKLLLLSKNARTAFLLLMEGYELSSGYSWLDVSNQTKTKQNTVYLGIAELVAEGLVLRIKPGMYLLNPTSFIPGKEDLRKPRLQQWLDLGGYLTDAVIREFKLTPQIK